MQISDLLELEKKKKQLGQKKTRLLKKRLKQKELQQINIDHSSVKKGFIEKTKIIKKKQYEKIVQKGRKIAIQIQDNVNVNTFLTDNQNFNKIYERTKKIINIDSSRLNKAASALSAYASQQKQNIVQLHLIFQNQIQCSLRPYQLKLPYKNSAISKNNWIIMLVKNAKTIQKSQNFKKVLGMIEIKEINQFIKAWKNDKKFKKKIDRERPLILCQFGIFKISKFIQNIMNKNYMVFPLQTKKVPYSLQQTFKNYQSYINSMIFHQYTLIKSGSDHTVHLKVRQTSHLSRNIQEAIYIFVAKSIERNKNKGNRLLKAQIKTKSSIPFQIYKYQILQQQK